MHVEFTYEGEELVTVDLTIEEVNCMPVSLEQIGFITAVLGQWNN